MCYISHANVQHAWLYPSRPYISARLKQVLDMDGKSCCCSIVSHANPDFFRKDPWKTLVCLMSFTADVKLRVAPCRYLICPLDSRLKLHLRCRDGGWEIPRSYAFAQVMRPYLIRRVDTPIIHSLHLISTGKLCAQMRHPAAIGGYPQEVIWFIPSLTQTLAPPPQHAQRDPAKHHDRLLELAFEDLAGQLAVELRFKVMH